MSNKTNTAIKGSVRLDRLLSNLGYGSRKDVTILIKRGGIKISGKSYKNPAEKIDLSRVEPETFTIYGEALDPLPPLTLMLHKPVGYVCSHDDPGGGEDIFTLLPPRFRFRKPSLGIAGRLDKDSSGLVLLTDDGQLLHRIITPHNPTSKTYHVTLDRPLQGKEKALFASGTLMLKGETKALKPADMTVTGDKSADIILEEGRYHQIRRMFAATGNHVTALHRSAIGAISLGSLPEGEWRILNAEELAQL